ncbi:MAG: secretin N-terminal domain-containing protein [Candidatus Omnitrophota bacterium]
MKNIFTKIIIVGVFLVLFIPLTSAEVSKRLGHPEYSKRISMDFQDANVKDVLKVFSQQSELNFIASDELKDRTITLFLQDVPVEEALELLLTANNLTYEIQEGSNIFIVKETPESLQTTTKIFFLKYASVSNSRLRAEISEGLVRGEEFTRGEEGAGGGGGAVGETTAEEVGIKQIVENVLSEVGKVIEDPRTNSLIITDLPSQFPVIENTIARLDVPTPQVLIEVEMLDVSKNLVDKLGVDWGATETSWVTYSGPSRDNAFPIKRLSGSATRDFTMGTLSMAGLDIALDLLTTDTSTKYLARPRILTLSNETAEIKIVTDEAIGLNLTSSGEGSATQQTEEAERAETGVALRVTPQVSLEIGEITMFIEPTVSEAATSTLSEDYRDPERRQTKSLLRIKDGETIVIGGLIRNRETEVITKVPILGDIPFLGALFRHKDKSRGEDRELMIFITPRIVKGRGLNRSRKPMAYLPPVREQEPIKPESLFISRETKVDMALSEFEKR